MKSLLAGFLLIAGVAFGQAATPTPTPAPSGPFLVSASVAANANAALNPATYQITGLGSAVVTVPVTTNADGTLELHLSLAGVANGTYTVTAVAVNSQGFAGPASSPFLFTLPVATPGAPSALSLSPN